MNGGYFTERKEMREVKKLLSEYGVLDMRQLCAYFHYKSEDVIRGMILYMSRNKLIATDPLNRLAVLNQAELCKEPDHKIIASFWAMLQYAETIEFHSRAQFPAQIYFFSEGVEYEVLYVPYGDENLMNSIYARETENDTRYLVVVEDPCQLETLYIPRVEWFCTVADDGVIRKYIQED